MKALQRWLLYNVVEKWPVHDAAFGYRTGRSIRDNASSHSTSSYLLRMDLKNFFPSIRARDISAFLGERPPGTEDWDERDYTLFKNITCRYEALTIGSPTSPALSNAICFQLDSRISGLATETSVTYTRYADDLFFSTDVPNVLVQLPERIASILRNLECPLDLTINSVKTRHSSKSGRRQVTGLVLTSDGRVSLGRQRRRFIRRQIHRIDDLSECERLHLAGLIAFAIDIEPDLLNALILKYGMNRVLRAQQKDIG